MIKLFDIRSETKEDLQLALQIAFSKDPKYSDHVIKAASWSVDVREQTFDGPVERMILHSHFNAQQEGIIRFPCPLDQVAALGMVAAWLDTVEYPRRPDFDGSCHRAWRAYNEVFANSASTYEQRLPYGTIAAFEPYWMEYHK